MLKGLFSSLLDSETVAYLTGAAVSGMIKLSVMTMNLVPKPILRGVLKSTTYIQGIALQMDDLSQIHDKAIKYANQQTDTSLQFHEQIHNTGFAAAMEKQTGSAMKNLMDLLDIKKQEESAEEPVQEEAHFMDGIYIADYPAGHRMIFMISPFRLPINWETMNLDERVSWMRVNADMIDPASPFRSEAEAALFAAIGGISG